MEKGEWKKGYNRKPNRMKESERSGWIKKNLLERKRETWEVRMKKKKDNQTS